VEGTRHATYGLAGDSLLKRWNTVGDEKVRPHHIATDQQERRIGAPFYCGAKGMPGSDWLMYPGDPNGPVHLTINCRCWLEYEVAEAFGSLFDDIADVSGAAKR
jgi:hypothetical protein